MFSSNSNKDHSLPVKLIQREANAEYQGKKTGGFFYLHGGVKLHSFFSPSARSKTVQNARIDSFHDSD